MKFSSGAFLLSFLFLMTLHRPVAAQQLWLGAVGNFSLLPNGNGASGSGLNGQVSPQLYLTAVNRRGSGITAGVGIAGYRYRLHTFSGQLLATQRLRYLEVPLALRFRIGRKRRPVAAPYGEAGLSFGFLTDADYRAAPPVWSYLVLKDASNEADFRKVALRAMLGVGIVWWGERRLSLLTGLQTNFGIYNQYKGDEVLGRAVEAPLSGVSLRVGVQVRCFE